MNRPETDPVALLVARLVAQLGLVENENVFAGPPRFPGGGVATRAVFLAVGSGTVTPTFGDHGLGRPVVQIRVRGDGGAGFQEGLTLARACMSALDGWTPNTEGYLLVRSIQPEPVNLWFDPSGNPEWTFNVQLTWSG